MAEDRRLMPDYIFEISWEVCNKVGGIHTVVSSKALSLVREWKEHFILIGPDVWKGAGSHPEFEEDKELFKSWRSKAETLGLNVKTGRWKITGRPVVILVDFTCFFNTKNDILRDMWLRFKVDSITGQWDYIEPALFGYAAGKVIESFYQHYITFSDKVVAQFHEWMTGAGLLYLEEHVPQIGTVFTTHATVTGRAIAGNGLPLYSRMADYEGDIEARRYNVLAKHSLEKQSARYADCFTTVSEITARECVQFLEKRPEVLTPNGFEDSFVPDIYLLRQKRSAARSNLLSVASALLNKELSADTFLIMESGRYEFRNKGIDLMIDALGKLNAEAEKDRELVAFFFNPASHTGPRRDLLEKLDGHDINIPADQQILTHYLQGRDADPILKEIEKVGLSNTASGKLHIIFAPVYLNGMDGIFNMPYYDVLCGFDLTVFPSYYEPWGYTPLESLAFHIPTITSTLAGFGMLVQNAEKGVYVISRTDENYNQAVDQASATIRSIGLMDASQYADEQAAAYQLSKRALWNNLLDHYFEAYHIALQQSKGREALFVHEPSVKEWEETVSSTGTMPIWRKVLVKTQLPDELAALVPLSMNLWWTWNAAAEALWERTSPLLWESTGHNPVAMLENLSFTDIKRLTADVEYLSGLQTIYDRFCAYMNTGLRKDFLLVAYLCMEYGLHSSIRLYAGGLGVLAGDILKQQSDNGNPFLGIGLLYRNGYFRQYISASGEQIEEDSSQKFSQLPLRPLENEHGEGVRITIPFPGRTLYARAWQVDVGRSRLFLLDTDFAENTEEDRAITSQLYGGDAEMRLKQEILLGIGGVRLLYILKEKPEIYHCNEGHAAFMGLERIYHLMFDENIPFEEALELVRASSLFTTHTSVEAGHDTFSEDMLRTYLSHYPPLLNISWLQLMQLGKLHGTGYPAEKFSMSYLAARLCGNINAVSRIHRQVSRRLFSPLWPGCLQEELPIGYVTNGIHLATWLASAWKELYSKGNETDSTDWELAAGAVNDLPGDVIWKTHGLLKRRLLEYVHEKMRIGIREQHLDQTRLSLYETCLHEDTLVIGFARRMVPYKRASLLLRQIDRLTDILCDANRPVLLLFAGKAHPNDPAGQQLLREIITVSKRPELEGKVIFLEDYDMEMARLLVQGVDVWLNTPEYGMEASGTSGMKAAINGALNLSTADGWWAEAYKPETGWIIREPRYSSMAQRDKADAETLINMISNEILPLYFTKGAEGYPEGWVHKMRSAMSEYAAQYSAARMNGEYAAQFYLPARERTMQLSANSFSALHHLLAYRKKVTDAWGGVQVLSVESPGGKDPLPMGSVFQAAIVINPNGLTTDEIGAEMLTIGKTQEKEQEFIISKTTLHAELQADGFIRFSGEGAFGQSGVYRYGFRLFARFPDESNGYSLFRWL